MWHRLKWRTLFDQMRTRFGVAALGSTLLWIGVHHSPLGRMIERQVSRPVEFGVRHRLEQDPVVDPRLIIYGLGDSALSYLNSPELTLAEWGALVEYFAGRGAKAVFINKVFGMPLGVEEAKKFNDAVARARIPVIMGAFVGPHEIPGRVPLDLSDGDHQMQSFLSDAGEDVSWLPSWRGIPYGPHPSISGSVRVGHLSYDGNFRFGAFWRIGERGILPLAPLLAFGDPKLSSGRISSGDTEIPHDGKGSFLVNLPHPKAFYQRTFNLAGPVKNTREGLSGLPYEPGAIVVVIPALFTGNTDMVSSPFGVVPGGFLSAATINSVLTRQWITEFSAPSLLIALVAIPACLIGIYLSGFRFWLSCLFVGLTIPALGLAAFSYWSVESPWFVASANFAWVSIGLFAIRARTMEKKLRLTQDFLEGLVPREKLKAIVRKAGINLEPTERVVSTLFVDVVGFSVAADQFSPKKAFEHLRGVIRRIIEVVHRNGGVVDKIHGDGVLCFFGYYYDGEESAVDHADAAVRCAIELQLTAVERAYEAALLNEPVFPLRIGVNSSAVQIGNLGTGKKVEITLIGHGVNFCKRLESAADSFGILVGATTKDLIVNRDQIPATLTKRLIAVKHLENPELAFECLPNAMDQSKKAKALSVYREQTGLKRLEVRWPLPRDVEIRVQTTFGSGKVIDFSASGVGILIDRFLARGVFIQVILDDPQNVLRTQLQEVGLSPLQGTVCWADDAGDGTFRCGVQLRGMNDTQKGRFLEILRERVENRESVRKTA